MVETTLNTELIGSITDTALTPPLATPLHGGLDQANRCITWCTTNLIRINDAEARIDIANDIVAFYSTERLYSVLGTLPPFVYEREMAE